MCFTMYPRFFEIISTVETVTAKLIIKQSLLHMASAPTHAQPLQFQDPHGSVQSVRSISIIKEPAGQTHRDL